MKSVLKNIVLVGAVALLAGCGAESSSSSRFDDPATREAMRKMSADMDTIAESLSKVYGRHDKQYYIDRLNQILSKCVANNDFESCYKSNYTALQNE